MSGYNAKYMEDMTMVGAFASIARIFIFFDIYRWRIFVLGFRKMSRNGTETAQIFQRDAIWRTQMSRHISG